jgi:DNA-binding NarL/FixJ family response regulator
MRCQKDVNGRQEAVNGDIGLQAILDTLSVSILLLNSNSEVLFANKAAESIFSSKNWFRVTDGKLRCNARDHEELSNYVRMAAANQIEDTDNVLFLSGRDSHDGLLLAFSALRAGNDSDDAQGALLYNVVAVVIEPNQHGTTEPELLKRLYSLTDAEAKIAAYLANGLDYSEIAKQRNVSVSTVRSYSKSIFKKLCVNSRAGVVRKVLAASIPLNLYS